MEYTKKELNEIYENLADSMAKDLMAQLKWGEEFKYWYYVANKYYELLKEYLSIAAGKAETTYQTERVEAEQELSDIIQEFDNDTEKNWRTNKRELTREFLAYYCREYREIYKSKVPETFNN